MWEIFKLLTKGKNIIEKSGYAGSYQAYGLLW